jgi:hypothetical protein
VSDTERIYSLYVQANPVPDPGRLAETPHEAGLLMIERSRTMDTQQRPASRETKRPPRWRTAVIAFAAVIVVVGATIGIATLITNDNDTAATPETVQTLTFDGQSITYRGPDTFQAGTVFTITLENTSDETVQFNVARLRDEDMTLEEFRAAHQAGENPVSSGQSIEEARSGVPARSVVDAEVRLDTEGTYVLDATIPFFDEQGLMAKERYFAGLIEVTGD